jgi:hypothetical protein
MEGWYPARPGRAVQGSRKQGARSVTLAWATSLFTSGGKYGSEKEIGSQEVGEAVGAQDSPNAREKGGQAHLDPHSSQERTVGRAQERGRSQASGAQGGRKEAFGHEEQNRGKEATGCKEENGGKEATGCEKARGCQQADRSEEGARFNQTGRGDEVTWREKILGRGQEKSRGHEARGS